MEGFGTIVSFDLGTRLRAESFLGRLTLVREATSFGGVRAVAQEIRNNVRRATGLSCSIGVTPNKLLAKIASELDKPAGLTVLTHDDLPRRIWPLPVRDRKSTRLNSSHRT